MNVIYTTADTALFLEAFFGPRQHNAHVVRRTRWQYTQQIARDAETTDARLAKVMADFRAARQGSL